MNRQAENGILIAGMILCWSVFYAVSKFAVDAIGSPYLAGGLLRAAALIFLTAQLFLMKKAGLLFKQGKSIWILFVIGTIGFLGDLFANLGYAKGSLGMGTALLKTDVLMANLVTVLIYRKKLTAFDWLGTFIMLGGVLLVLNFDFATAQFHVYDLFFLLSAGSLAANSFVIKIAQQRYGKDPDIISYFNNLTVLTLFTIASAIGGDLGRTGAVIQEFPWQILLGGLAQTGIYFFYYRNLQRHEVWKVKLYLLLMPVVSCIFGVIFFHEALTARSIIGIAVVLLGAGLLLLKNRMESRKQIPETAVDQTAACGTITNCDKLNLNVEAEEQQEES